MFSDSVAKLPNIPYQPLEFSDSIRQELSKYFTNLDEPVFVVRGMPETDSGALACRYSRSTKSARKVFEEEFLTNPTRGEDFYERVLAEYGDDSVAEMGGAKIFLEGISNVVTKIVEDSRIGLSPIEKSSRYVSFSQKVNGEYGYYRDPNIMASSFAEDYIDACNQLFDTYTWMHEHLTKFLKEKFPNVKGESENAYNRSIKAKAYDIERVLLPASTITNVALVGNGRAFEYLLAKMYAHELTEPKDVAKAMHEELNKIIPVFLKRANDEKGKAFQNYLIETNKDIGKIAKRHFGSMKRQHKKEVTLIDFDKDAEVKFVTAALYPKSGLSLPEVREIVSNMSEDERKEVIKAYMSHRTNRRHRPGRAAENVHYTFDILGNLGIYRDLHRHRQLTQERQPYTVEHGYDTPAEIFELGQTEPEVLERFDNAMNMAAETFQKISSVLPNEAQYVVPLGYREAWYFTLNLRELYHLVELRSQPQGHPDYRRIVQEMYKQVKEVHPNLVEYMNFVNLDNVPKLERLEAEKRTERKLEEIRRKQSSSQSNQPKND